MTNPITSISALVVTALLAVMPYPAPVLAQPDGAEDTFPTLPESPLEGLPSTPGSHIKSVAQLGDNEWLELEPPAADANFGRARGRAWGGQSMVLANDLRGAFFFGEGRHAYVKPDGFAMDDLWFYDINGNRWICVYPGLHIASFNRRVNDGALRIDEHGQLVDQSGQHLPVHTLIHAWDFLTYDERRRRFAWIGNSGLRRYYLPGLDQMDPGLTELERQREERPGRPMSPWYYDVAKGSFLREPARNAGSDVGGYSGFVYVPTEDLFFNAGSKGVQTFDPGTNSWTRVNDAGPRPPGYDHGLAYDREYGRLYMGVGTHGGDPNLSLFIYDLKSAQWSNPRTRGPAPKSFRTYNGGVMYDSVSNVVTVVHRQDRLVYTYSPDTLEWSSSPIPDSVPFRRYDQLHAFFDPMQNVYYIYLAGDSWDDGRMWVYRYRRAPA